MLRAIFVLIYFNLFSTHADSAEISQRILYGDDVLIEEHPYFAGLVNCGAAIISDRYLLTAAHCFGDSRVRKFIRHAYVGGETINNSQMVEFEDFKIHEDYFVLDGIPFNDIALIRLKYPLRFSNKIQAIKLPTRVPALSSDMVFIGRGIDETGNPSKELRKMDVRKLSVTECISLIPRQYHSYVKKYKNALAQINICAKRTVDKPGMCFGDSGSPLVQDNVVVGLASYGGTTCEKNRLGFYVNVAHYVDWIKRTTGLR